MAVELIIAPEAQQDVDEAYTWYEGRRPGLGEEFLSCVDACIQTISRMPELCAKVHEEYRRSLVRRFPYVIFYEYSERLMLGFTCVQPNYATPYFKNVLRVILSSSLYNCNLIRREVVKFVNHLVNLLFKGGGVGVGVFWLENKDLVNEGDEGLF